MTEADYALLATMANVDPASFIFDRHDLASTYATRRMIERAVNGEAGFCIINNIFTPDDREHAIALTLAAPPDRLEESGLSATTVSELAGSVY